MRDALSIFDQVASFSQGNITYQKVIEDLNVLDADNYFQLVDLALQNKVSDMMLLLNKVINNGFDGGHLISGLASHVRNVLMAKDEQTLPLLEVSEKQRLRYQEQAKKCPTPFLYKALEIMNRCDINYRQSSNKRLLVELTLIEVAQITQPDDDSTGAGRSPKRLKSLFKNLLISQPKPASQVAGAQRHTAPQAKPESSPKSQPHVISTELPTKPEVKVAVAKSDTGHLKKLHLGSMGLTFDDLRRGPQKPIYVKEAPTLEAPEAKSDFTESDLEKQWMMMCNRMPPEMKALAARMRNIIPTIKKYPQIEIEVDNEFLLSEINAIKGRIKVTLANALHNAAIDISLQLTKREDLGKVLTRKEIFDEFAKKNPSIHKLRDALGLELA